MTKHDPPRPRPTAPARPGSKSDATIEGVPVRLMAIEDLPPTAILVVEVADDVCIDDDGVQRIHQILMDRLAVRDVLVFTDGVKLAGVYDVPESFPP